MQDVKDMFCKVTADTMGYKWIENDSFAQNDTISGINFPAYSNLSRAKAKDVVNIWLQSHILSY